VQQTRYKDIILKYKKGSQTSGFCYRPTIGLTDTISVLYPREACGSPGLGTRPSGLDWLF